MKLSNLVSIRRRKNEKGYTLLEYTAGAVVIVTAVYAALQTFGVSMSQLLGSLGDWAEQRASEIDGAGTNQNP